MNAKNNGYVTVVFSTNGAKDFMVFTDSPIDGSQIMPSDR